MSSWDQAFNLLKSTSPRVSSSRVKAEVPAYSAATGISPSTVKVMEAAGQKAESQPHPKVKQPKVKQPKVKQPKVKQPKVKQLKRREKAGKEPAEWATFGEALPLSKEQAKWLRRNMAPSVEKGMSSWSEASDLLKGHGCKGCAKCGGKYEGKSHQHSDEGGAGWGMVKAMDEAKPHDLGEQPKPIMRSQPVQSPAQTAIPIHTMNADHTHKHMNLLRVDNKPISSTNPYPESREGIKNRVSIAGAGETHSLEDGAKVLRHAEYHEPTNTHVVSHSKVGQGKSESPQGSGGGGDSRWELKGGDDYRHPQDLTFHGKGRHYHGPHQVYHQGKLVEHTNIADNKREGPKYKWLKDGKLASAVSHRDNTVVGMTGPIKEGREGNLHTGDLTLPHPSKYASLRSKQPHPKMSESRAQEVVANQEKQAARQASRAASKKAHAENPNLKYLHLDKSMSGLNLFKGHLHKGITSWFESSDTLYKSGWEEADDLLKSNGKN